MEHASEERSSVVWVSPFSLGGEPRLALSQCPVSFIGAESVSLIEEFVAHVAAGGSGDIRKWAARRVDAFTVLYAEMKKQERAEHGER
jgi:hypothetical protein